MDVVLALLGLIVGAPLMALIALLIRLDSPGKAIFSQPRLGLGGRLFLMHKFRKFPDHWGTQGAAVTVAADARMTRLGRILERTKLDELPQLWNILRGDMSFVGPRPETREFKDLFTGAFTHVHDYLPGIFGPNQVAFRNESRLYPPDQDPETFYRQQLFPQKARNDLEYFSRATVISDALWIARGLWCSLVGVIDWQRMLRLSGRVFVADFMFIQLAWLSANLLRFEGLPSGYHQHVYITGTWLLPLMILPTIVLAGNYRSKVRHFSLTDTIRLVVSGFVGWSLAYFALLTTFERNASIGIGTTAFLMTLILMITARILYGERCKRLMTAPDDAEQYRTREGDPRCVVALYGAGHRGVALANLLSDGFSNARVVGFLDDNDRDLSGRSIAGYPILGSERDLDTVHAVHRIDQLWVSFEPNRHKDRRLREWCEKNDIFFYVLPLAQPFRSLSRLSEVASPSVAEKETSPSLTTAAGYRHARMEVT